MCRIGYTMCAYYACLAHGVYSTWCALCVCRVCHSMYTTDTSQIYTMYIPYEPFMGHVCPMCIVLRVRYPKQLCLPSGCIPSPAVPPLLVPQVALMTQESPREKELFTNLNYTHSLCKWRNNRQVVAEHNQDSCSSCSVFYNNNNVPLGWDSCKSPHCHLTVNNNLKICSTSLLACVIPLPVFVEKNVFLLLYHNKMHIEHTS